MDLRIEQSPQAYRINAESRSLRADIGRLMEGRICVKIRMTVEAGHAEALIRNLAVLCLVKLFLRERRQEQQEPLHLHRRYDPVHNLVKILDRKQLTSRYVTEFSMGGEKDRRW